VTDGVMTGVLAETAGDWRPPDVGSEEQNRT